MKETGILENNEVRWAENVVLVDGDYIDRVAFDLTVNFERMLERRIPQADLAHWLDCVALDGGVREGDNETQVIFLHRKDRLANFNPSAYNDINGMAFKDNLGEFAMSAYKVEDLVSTEDFFTQTLDLVLGAEEVKHIVLVPDAEHYISSIKHSLRNTSKACTVLSMQPFTGGNCRQEILGYSLMSALGIKSEEISSRT